MTEARGHSIEMNGATLYYEERGTGTPVVLIHGGLVSSAMWEPVLPQLGGDFRVITPDSRGPRRGRGSLEVNAPRGRSPVAGARGADGTDVARLRGLDGRRDRQDHRADSRVH